VEARVAKGKGAKAAAEPTRARRAITDFIWVYQKKEKPDRGEKNRSKYKDKPFKAQIISHGEQGISPC